MPLDKTEDNCHCNECRTIHEEFIEQFGRWPNMNHEDGQELKHRRESNERSWELAMSLLPGTDMTRQEVEDQAVHFKERMSGEQHE